MGGTHEVRPFARLVWLLTGIAWAATSLILFAGPQYWDPVTILDWTAVWTYTIAWLLFAPSVLLLGRMSTSRTVVALAIVSAVGAVIVGSANALEDGFGVEGAENMYVVGFLWAWLSLIPLAVAQWLARDSTLSRLTIVLFLGIALSTLGGGFIILASLAAIAIVPERFAPVSLSPTR
jgi:hypothetical protein